MKTITKLLAIVALFIGAARFAQAAPLSGSLSFAGSYSGAFGPSTITFAGNPLVLFGGTQDLAMFNGGTTSMTFNYPMGGPSSAPSMIFAAPYGSNMALVFNVSSAIYSPQTGVYGGPGYGPPTFVFTGLLAEVQYSGTLNGQTCTMTAPCVINSANASTLSITPSGSPSGSGAYSATITATATPEPSSLLLLGTGLVGAAGMMVLKRRFV